MGVGLQPDEENCGLNKIGTEDALQLTVISNGLTNRLRTLVDHVERIVHRDMVAEASVRQHPAAFQHRAQVVAHPHFAHELLRPRRDADLEIAHPGLHHQLSQFWIQIVGPDVGSPTDVGQALSLDGP